MIFKSVFHQVCKWKGQLWISDISKQRHFMVAQHSVISTVGLTSCLFVVIVVVVLCVLACVYCVLFWNGAILKHFMINYILNPPCLSNQAIFVTRLTKGSCNTLWTWKINFWGMLIWYHGIYQGFQLLGIAWREKHQVRSARTHECGPGPPIGPLMVSREKALQGSKAAPPCVGKFVFGEVECISSGP